MKTKYFFLAAAAALFAACSSDDGIAEQQQAKQQAEQVPVAFGAYVNRATRAGEPGELTNYTIGLDKYNFGVFAYYTDNQPYSETSTPNFMYNQKVSKSTDKWVYSPLKYWPNEFGTGAISDGEDRLTLFAYAPWVSVTPETGLATDAGKTGIIALTRNTATGDPYVKYYADFDPDKSVDLCWGVAAEDFSSTVDGPTANNIAAGKVYQDVIKPKTDAKIKFNFKHALAALNVQIDADVDVASHNTSTLDGTTKIWVRSVSFTGFTDKGMLNLNGDAINDTYTPNWFDLSGNTKIGSGTVTIFDGRRDGKEGQAGAEVSNEKPLGLNDVLIQSEPYKTASPLVLTDASKVGVQNTAVNLFNSNTLTAPVYVIPTEENLEITIVYDVETSDNLLASYLSDGKVKGSTIENKITKTIKISNADVKLQAGKRYTINLHLGMTSVKFDAQVTDWTVAASNVDLPHNTPAGGGGGGGAKRR